MPAALPRHAAQLLCAGRAVIHRVVLLPDLQAACAPSRACSWCAGAGLAVGGHPARAEPARLCQPQRPDDGEAVHVGGKRGDQPGGGDAHPLPAAGMPPGCGWHSLAAQGGSLLAAPRVLEQQRAVGKPRPVACYCCPCASLILPRCVLPRPGDAGAACMQRRRGAGCAACAGAAPGHHAGWRRHLRLHLSWPVRMCLCTDVPGCLGRHELAWADAPPHLQGPGLHAQLRCWR